MAATHLDEVAGDLPPAGSEPDLITSSRVDKTLTVVHEWVRTGLPPSWSDCAGLSPELRSWHLQFGNFSIDSDGRLWRRRAPPAMALQFVIPTSERMDSFKDIMIPYSLHIWVSPGLCADC